MCQQSAILSHPEVVPVDADTGVCGLIGHFNLVVTDVRDELLQIVALQITCCMPQAAMASRVQSRIARVRVASSANASALCNVAVQCWHFQTAFLRFRQWSSPLGTASRTRC